MPPITESNDEPTAPRTEAAGTTAGDDALLMKDGQYTLESQTLAAFLANVDWDDLFEVEALADHIEGEFALGRHVQDPDTNEVYLELFAEVEGDTADEDLQAHGEAVEEKAYKGKKGKMKGMKSAHGSAHGEEEPEEDKPAEEGESQAPMPAHGSLSAATRRGMAGMMGGKIRIGYNNGGTAPTTVGKGDKQHKPGVKPLNPADYDGKMSYAMEGDEAPEGLEWFVVETLTGDIVAEFVDADDLMAMLPYFIDGLPEDTLEDRARKALFHDLMEIDYAASMGVDHLDAEGIEEAKRLFKKGDFRKKMFAKKGPGTPEHSQRMRMMIAMLKKGAIVRAGSGKGYKKGGYKYQGPKSGRPALKKAYARYKMKKIGLIKKSIKKHKVLRSQKRMVKTVIYKNLGTKMPKGWKPPQDRPDLGLGAMYRGAKMKARGKAGKTVAASAPQTPANLIESAPGVETEGYRLARSYVGSGPRLAGLVENTIRGARAEHQEAIAEAEAEKKRQLNG